MKKKSQDESLQANIGEWKYGLILIKPAEAKWEADYCELVELYPDDNGEYTIYAKPQLCNVESINIAQKDIERDGVNTYFYDNGTFSYENGSWVWNKYDPDAVTYGVCLDYDGVIHSYKSGFQGVFHIPDPPNPGAFEFIRKLLKHNLKVYVFSTRSRYPGGLIAMKEWFLKHGMPEETLAKINFPEHKPIAKIYIDDRAWRFERAWPTINYLNNFTPWHGGRSSSENK